MRIDKFVYQYFSFDWDFYRGINQINELTNGEVWDKAGGHSSLLELYGCELYKFSS